MRGKDPQTSNILIEGDLRIFQHLLRRRQLAIGFLRWSLKLYITIMRCLKCHSLKHLRMDKCTNMTVCGIFSDNYATDKCQTLFNDKKRSCWLIVMKLMMETENITDRHYNETSITPHCRENVLIFWNYLDRIKRNFTWSETTPN